MRNSPTVDPRLYLRDLAANRYPWLTDTLPPIAADMAPIATENLPLTDRQALLHHIAERIYRL